MRAITNPAKHNATPTAARTAPRPLTTPDPVPATPRVPGLASYSRDKLWIGKLLGPAVGAPAWRSFEFQNTYCRAGDSAFWSRETQRPPHRFYQRLLRSPSSGSHPHLGASPRVGRRAHRRVE